MLRSIVSRSTSLVALVALVPLVGACGETNIHAIRRLTPVYDAHRRALVEAVAELPPPGEVGAWVVPQRMNPPAVFSERQTNDPHATAEILQIEELEGREAPMTLSIRSPLHFCLAWTGPHNPLDPSVFGNRGGLGAECEAALARPWLVLIRTVELRLPERLRMEAFVLDRRLNRVVAALPIDVWGRYGNADVGRGPWASEANRMVSSAFHEAASCEIALQLSRLPGSRISLDRRGCDGPFLDIAVPGWLTPRVAEPQQERGVER